MVNMFKYVLAGVVCTANAFYDSASSKVVTLSAKDFDQKVIKSDEIWYVEFYAPWCGHCKNLTPHWDTAARKLKGVVKLGAVNVDAEENKSLGSTYGITGFPTIKVFGLNKKKGGVDYQGAREADGIVKHALQTVQSQVMERLNGKAGGSKSGGSSGGSKGSSGGSGSGKDEVITLDSTNFDRIVYGSKDIIMVEFYAPWCGHCKALEPEYKTAAGQLRGQVKLAKMDCDDASNKGICGRIGVQGFPTLKYWDYGLGKSDATAKDYQGQREAKAIVDFCSTLADKADIEPEITEIYTKKQYENNCQGPVICVIAFLPNIYDSNANDRNGYLDTLKKIAKKNRKHPFNWFWLSAGDQLDLERDLQLGFGFPAVVAVSPQKKMIATMRSSYSQSGINDWVNGLLTGRGGLVKLSKPLDFKKVDKWDGKDAPVIQEDEYEYDEL